MSGKIARAFLGACGSDLRDIVQHVGCTIEHASMMFSKLVSLIRVFLFCRAGSRKYYIVLGFAIHEHISIMGDFNHGNIKWDTLQSTEVEDQQFLCLVQDNFLTQHVLEPTRATRILDIVLSSQKELVDNVEIKETLGSSDHNQMHFDINIKSDRTKVKQCMRDFRKGNYKEIRKSLTLLDWNDKMKNKAATECWNILRGELDSAIDSYVPMKQTGNDRRRNICQKRLSERLDIKKYVEGL